MTRVKICGCMSVGDALAAADAGADFIGIMFAESRRRVSREEAAAIVSALGTPLRELGQDEPPPLHPGRFATDEAWFAHGAEALERLLARKRPLVVGVFSGQPIDEVNEIADETGIDLVQLSGGEPWDECLLATRQAIKVVHPAPDATTSRTLAHMQPGSALAVMLDASRGAGRTGDWQLAAAVGARMPVWLAGGLTPDNVGDAIAQAHPWAVDVSSGVERAGRKDAGLIRAFVRAARDAVEPRETRKDRSLDLSAPSVRPPVGTSGRYYARRKSSPRAPTFDYRGGHAYHLVVLTSRRARLLSDRRWAAFVVDGLCADSERFGFDLLAYCVMPDHMHILVAGDAERSSSLASFVHRLKQMTGYAYRQATGATLWHRSYYDHVVRPNEPLEAHAAYIVGNPVTAGLVEKASDWEFSGPDDAFDANERADRSKDLSLRVEQLSRELDEHEVLP